MSSERLKGNISISVTAARRTVQEFYDSLRDSLPGIYIAATQYRFQQFLEEYRETHGESNGSEPTVEEIFAAKEAGVFDQSEIYVPEEVPGKVVDKVVRYGRLLNECSGHNLDASGRRRERRRTRRSGGGFSYRPEIPYQQAGNGEFLDCGDGYEDSGLPRYGRKNHPEQSLPKIEWAVERSWRNKYRKPSNRFNTTVESKRLKAQVAKARRVVVENPELFQWHPPY